MMVWARIWAQGSTILKTVKHQFIPDGVIGFFIDIILPVAL
jgi:hypothetical protein